MVVYTASIGDFGDVVLAPDVEDTAGAEFVLFSDVIHDAPAPWKVRRPVWEHSSSSRRTARYHKINSHLLFPGELTVWHDASHRLSAPLPELLEPATAEFCSFRHPERDCIYSELQACVAYRKDSQQLMLQQTHRYQAERYPRRNGLYETSVIVRRPTPAVKAINTMWWRELERGSYRDQLSLNYVIWKLRLKSHCGFIPGWRTQSPCFTFRAHR